MALFREILISEVDNFVDRRVKITAFSFTLVTFDEFYRFEGIKRSCDGGTT